MDATRLYVLNVKGMQDLILASVHFFLEYFSFHNLMRCAGCLLIREKIDRPWLKICKKEEEKQDGIVINSLTSRRQSNGE